MPANIVAYIILTFAVAMGIVISFFNFNRSVVIKLGFIWVGILTAAMFGGMLVVAVFGIAIAMSLREDPPELKLFYFIGLLPILPLQVFQIPFPLVNYLWGVNFPKLLVLSLLFPLFFSYINKALEDGVVFRLSDSFFLMFFLVTTLLEVRSGTIANIIRNIFDSVIEYGAIYFAISYYLRSPHSLNWFFSFFLISASFISFISIAGSLVGWRLYGEILQAMNLVYGPAALIPYSRGFVTRASGGAMLQPLAVALYSAIVIVTAYFMMQKKQLKPLFGIPLMLVYLTVLIFTNSRGGWLVAMIGIAMLYYMKLNKVLKLLMSAVGTGLVVSVILFLAVGDLSAIDPEGTFQYRVDLISNSMSAVSNNLLFGSANFMSDPALQASMQGEGIIDIVNMYLEIALRKGLAALIPFIMVFIILIRDMAAKKGVMGTDHKDLLVAILVMIMVFVATCSSTSFIQWYVIIFLAVARAYTGFAEPQTSSVQASTSS